MATEMQLRKILVTVFEHLRRQQSEISSLTVEVAALRESLIEIGPGYDDVLTRQRSLHVKEARLPTFEMFREYETIIQKLKDDDLI